MLIISILYDFLMNKITEEQGYHPNCILRVFITVSYMVLLIYVSVQKIRSTNKYFYPGLCQQLMAQGVVYIKPQMNQTVNLCLHYPLMTG